MELFKVLGKVLMVCFPAWCSVLFVGVISLCLSSPIAEKIKKKKQSYHGIILSTVENVIVEWLAISRSI